MKQNIQNTGKYGFISLPSELLKAWGITDEIDLSVQDKTIMLRPVRAVRVGWEEAFAAAIAAGDEPEGDIFEGVSNKLDKTEW